MHLLVGLGNPGPQYRSTRHNLGWLVLDAAVAALGAGEWHAEPKHEADMIDYRSSDGGRWLFVKPTTFMNNSGRAVAQLASFYKVLPGDIVVVHDELDLPFGTVRTRLGGSAAGHHGIESVAHHLGSDAFWRVRCGIAPREGTVRQGLGSDYVLGTFSPDEHAALPAVIELSSNLVKSAVTSGTLTEVTATIP